MAGKYYDELQVGQHIKHSLGRTVTEMDSVHVFGLDDEHTAPAHQ